MTAPFRLDRTLIHVTGPDARRFLQDVLTQSLERLDDGEVRYAALLTAQGKVLTDMFVWGDEDGVGVILDLDPSRAADVVKRLTMYKLRAQATLAEANDAAIAWSPQAFDGARPDPRLPALGWRRLTAAAYGSNLGDGAEVSAAHRLTLGVPDLARDASADEVFAGEALLDELHGVDFQKGCFVGQENVSRMKRRATTRKKFCAVSFEGAPPAYGAPIRAGEAEIGSIRTGAPNRAIALIRLDRAQEAVAAGKSLTADNREIHLDPPPWLILPEGADAPR